jgi:hypothetical protein
MFKHIKANDHTMDKEVVDRMIEKYNAEDMETRIEDGELILLFGYQKSCDVFSFELNISRVPYFEIERLVKIWYKNYNEPIEA